jgi:hypothetical protein
LTTPKKSKKWNERFATRVLIVLAVATAIFIVAQYISFLITGFEQTVLIQCFFTVIGVECGAMMLKRVSEVVVARIKKEEQLDVPTETDYSVSSDLSAISTSASVSSDDETGGVG